MFSYLKSLLKRWKRILKGLKKNLVRLDFVDENFAHDLQQRYPDLISKTDARHRLRTKEKKIYSQHGEDGLILHLFDQIGTKHKIAVEFGIGGGQQCNTSNLAINFGWRTLLIEGDKKNFQQATGFYTRHPFIESGQVTVLNHFVTVDNIERILKENLPVEDPDLLSIDIDGNDYWIWKAIENIHPRLVVIEYNSSLGQNQSVTIKYEPAFNRFEKHSSGFYHGATLQAMTKLGQEKGYVLVGCESHGINAFFLRRDLADMHQIDALSPQDAFYANRKRTKTMSIRQQKKLIDHLQLVQI